MRKLMLASTVLLLIVGQAMAQSWVQMELEVGGSNNGATCENKQPFTPGSTADGTVVQLDPNGDVTWAVRIHAGGTEPGGEIRGVANYVFDLELYRDSVDPANLVTDATFTSTANTGNCGNEADPLKNPTADFLSNAAFPYTFNIHDSATPARIFDQLRPPGTFDFQGGTYLSVHCYPKAEPGKCQLFGMGAGYSAWVRGTAFTTYTTGGIGKGDAPSYPKPDLPGCVGDYTYGCLGWGPVAEGQIHGLASGTYVLRLIPGGGINVLRYQAANTNQEVFAIAADDASSPSRDDTITFVVDVPPQTHIVGWSSVREHPDGGTEYAIPLDAGVGPGGVASVETRLEGVKKIVVDFDQDISCCYQAGHVVLSGGLTLNGDPVPNGNQLVIPVANSADMGCYSINIAGAITSLADGEDTDCWVRTLAGDVTGDQFTDFIDMGQVKPLNGQPASTNPKFDVNHDGQIDFIDMAMIKPLNGNSTSCP